MKHIIRFAKTQAIVNLEILNDTAEAAEADADQQKLPSWGVPMRQQQTGTQTQWEKQKDIHKIAAQQFRISSPQHLKIGVEEYIVWRLKVARAAGQNRLPDNEEAAAKQ